MAGWSPPEPSRSVLAGAGVAYVVLLAYAVLVQGSLLLGVLPGFVLAALYIGWRVLVTLEAIADALHRIADED